jgi:hypothetical protein
MSTRALTYGTEPRGTATTAQRFLCSPVPAEGKWFHLLIASRLVVNRKTENVEISPVFEGCFEIYA